MNLCLDLRTAIDQLVRADIMLRSESQGKEMLFQTLSKAYSLFSIYWYLEAVYG